MRLKNPTNNKDVIRQDYRDKHSTDGSVLLCRKYDHELKVKGEVKKDKSGNPIIIEGDWFESKELTNSEDQYVKSNHFFSEKRHNNCYSTMNHFPTDYPPSLCEGKYRTPANLYSTVGYYIDFDFIPIHKIAKEQQASSEFVEEVLGYAEGIIRTLKDYLPGYSDFGMPIVSYTGGGLGFYFPLKPMKATEENKALYMAVYEKLYRRFNLLFAELAAVFENDHKVVGSERVIRVTGTWNSKIGTFSRYIARYGHEATNEVYRYSIADIIKLYHLDEITVIENEKSNERLVKDSPLQKKEKRKEEEAKKGSVKALGLAYTNRNNIIYPTKWYLGYTNAKQQGKYLELSVLSLEYLDSHSQENLNRNNALFLIACLLKEIEFAKCGYNDLESRKSGLIENIISYIVDLNDSLNTPLEDNELNSLVTSALRNQYSFRKLETIQKFLNLSDEEFDHLGWMAKQKKEQQKRERNSALTELDKEVVKLFLAGMSDAKIAKKLGITKRTSINIRQRLGVSDRGVKYEDIDFEGLRRHVKRKTATEVETEPEPVFPYMPWYRPTYKTQDANAVAERAKKLAELKNFSYTVDSVKKWKDSVRKVASMSEEEKKKIDDDSERRFLLMEKQELLQLLGEEDRKLRMARRKYGEDICRSPVAEARYNDILSKYHDVIAKLQKYDVYEDEDECMEELG